MKILYIAHERCAAQVAATALGRLVPTVRMSWAPTTSAALGWLRDNSDAAAVFADCASDNPELEAFLEKARGMGVTTPIAAVAPEHLHALSATLKADLDGLVEQERNKSAALAAQLEELREWRREAEPRLVRSEEQDAALVSTTRICTALEERQVELEAALHGADQRHAAQAAALERLARREAELSAAVAEAVAVRAAVEQRLAEAEVARQHAEQCAAEELAAAGERYQVLDDRLIRETAMRTTLEGRLAAAGQGRIDGDRRHASELAGLTARLGEREADHEAASARASKIIAALQQRLLELEAAVHGADERHAAEAAATGLLAARERELEAALTVAHTSRTAIGRRLSESESACQRVAVDLTLAAQRCSAFEDQVTKEVTARSMVEQRLAAAERAGHDADRRHATELEALTTRLADLQAERDLAASRSGALERQRDESGAALDRAHAGWRSEVAALTARLQQRETDAVAFEAEALTVRAALAEQADVGSREVVRLQQAADDLSRQLNAMRARAAALRRHADRVAVMERQLDESHKENRRQFERAPYGLCECTREGGVSRVNHSLAGMLGYRAADLQRMDIAATIFESVADLHWLLERTLQSSNVESVETTLKTLDHRRLFVRLHALSADGPVVLAVEDLTGLRAVEQRLREAQRMEAVGRVASEVAETCDTLLRDVSRGGRQWLAVLESDTPLRQQGELLLGDVNRAAGFLRQFVTYGHHQIDRVEPVSVTRVLHDMAPVLKRVLGDDITLLLPKTTDRFEVDLDAERVERILVNVANYARERMPNGGRVRLQLATAVVDRQFLASHPRVRPGAHVLITITEIQGTVWPVLPIHLPIGRRAPADAPGASSDHPGMDLGPLVALIGDSGGHLWMSAEPAGNTTLQIHLPKRTQDEVAEPDATDSWSDRGRHLTRWFRH